MMPILTAFRLGNALERTRSMRFFPGRLFRGGPRRPRRALVRPLRSPPREAPRIPAGVRRRPEGGRPPLRRRIGKMEFFLKFPFIFAILVPIEAL